MDYPTRREEAAPYPKVTLSAPAAAQDTERALPLRPLLLDSIDPPLLHAFKSTLLMALPLKEIHTTALPTCAPTLHNARLVVTATSGPLCPADTRTPTRAGSGTHQRACG
jgi:hypothetical protein